MNNKDVKNVARQVVEKCYPYYRTLKGPVISDGQYFSSTCLATLLHCKLKHTVARITTFVTNLSRSKIQRCKSAEFYTYNWSMVCNIKMAPSFI